MVSERPLYKLKCNFFLNRKGSILDLIQEYKRTSNEKKKQKNKKQKLVKF